MGNLLNRITQREQMGQENTTPSDVLTEAQAICQDDFDMKKYIGRWYEFSREKSTPFQKGDHGTADYAFTSEHAGIQVVNTEYLADKQKTNQVIGMAEQIHPTRAECR